MSRPLALALTALALLGAAGAGAEVRVVEAVGAVALHPGSRPARAPRDLARDRAIAAAVQQVARELLPVLEPEEEERLSAALGDRPSDYATRFRTLEDRGERPALFTSVPGAETEYVVLMEVQVDLTRVRQRLIAAGLLRPSGEARATPLRLVIEDVDGWASYRAVRTLLEEVGVRSAVPVELSRGRAVLMVEGAGSPDSLMTALARAAPPDLRLSPLGSDGDTLTLRARFLGTPAKATEPGARN